MQSIMSWFLGKNPPQPGSTLTSKQALPSIRPSFANRDFMEVMLGKTKAEAVIIGR